MPKSSPSWSINRDTKRHQATEVRAAKVWLLYTLPRVLGILAGVWAVLLLHAPWPEAAEFSATAASAEQTPRLFIPQTTGPTDADVWTEVWAQRQVQPGDVLSTVPTGQLALSLSGGGAIYLGPNTQARVEALGFNRLTRSRWRSFTLGGGLLAVRSGRAVGPQGQFAVGVGGRYVTGFQAVYVIWSDRVAVSSGVVRCNDGTTVPAGQTCVFGGGVRAQTPEEGQAVNAATAKLPPLTGPERAWGYFTDFELGQVLGRSSGLLEACGHHAGDGNPFARLGITNSSRRAQALKRAQDLVLCMGGGGGPGSGPSDNTRLDDFRSLGLDAERCDLTRQAFWRGQLLSLEIYPGGRGFKFSARANDRQRTLVLADANGAALYPGQ